MNIKQLHQWPDSVEEAKKIQKSLCEELIFKPFNNNPSIIAGADIAYDPKSGQCFSGVFIFDFQSQKLIEEQYMVRRIDFPYIPGYLSFRELPSLIDVFRKISVVPGLVFVDGHGIAHPRKIGLASHLGLWLNIPTIGIAKKKLVGNYEVPLAEKGKFSYLYNKDEIIGAVLRTKNKTNPVFISPGNLVDLNDAVRLTLEVCDGYRIPFPTRIADRKVGEFKRRNVFNG